MLRVDYLPVRAALETTLASDPRLMTDKHAALVALCRVTADQVDMAGDEVASRLIASYLSALKDLERAMSDRGAAVGGKVGKLGSLASVPRPQAS